VDNDTATAKGLQYVHEGRPCEQTRQPEPIGIVQASRGRTLHTTGFLPFPTVETGTASDLLDTRSTRSVALIKPQYAATMPAGTACCERPSAPSPELTLHRRPLLNPEPSTLRSQVFAGDYLGGAVDFKVYMLSQDAEEHGEKKYTVRCTNTPLLLRSWRWLTPWW
jgi:hypothetical protein